MSFPLVGNLSSEGFWTSQNDIFGTNTISCPAITEMEMVAFFEVY